MMRPMKLAGEQLSLAVDASSISRRLTAARPNRYRWISMKKSGVLQTVIDYLEEAGMKSEVFAGVEPITARSSMVQRL